MTTVPNLTNLGEQDVIDALRGLGVADSVTVYVYGSFSVSESYDDTDNLGVVDTSNPDPKFWQQFAATVGFDGTVSWQRPGGAGDIDVGETFWSFDIWGVEDDTINFGMEDPHQTTLAGWEAAKLFPDGPVAPAGPTAAVSSFVIELMSLHRPSAPGAILTSTIDGEPVDAVLTQYSDVSIKEILNDQTECRFTMSMHDPFVEHVGAYTFAARIWYRGQAKPVYWGPCTFQQEDYTAGTVVVVGVNTIRLQHHFLRRGDDAINEPDDNGHITLDGVGLGTLLDAAQNTLAQDTRGVPSLGIVPDDHSTSHATPLVGVARGDGVWERMRDTVEAAPGPDVEFDPLITTPGVYMKMRAWDYRGSDRTATVRWTYNVDEQPDNVSAVTASPLLPITHAHVLDSEKRYRVTRASLAESYARGIFVDWIEFPGSIRKDPTTHIPDLSPLADIAQATVDSYSHAPRSVEVTLRPDAAQTTFYREHFWPGDTTYVHAKRGFREFEGVYRITAVEIGADGPRGLAQTKVTVIPSVDVTADDEDA